MADVETTIPVIDGSAASHPNLVAQNASNAVAAQTVLRANGAMVANGNPLPSVAPPLPGITSSAYEGSCLLMNGPGTVYAIQVNATVSGFVMLLDLAVVPTPPIAVTPRRVWYFDAASQQALDKTFNPPLAMTNGAVLVFSSTAGFTFTSAGAVAQFSGEVVAS